MAILGFVGLWFFWMAFGLIQGIAGVFGIAHDFGWVWAGVALLAALIFRFTLPLTFGAFLCAMHIWGWSLPFAALFAAPGLLLLIPGMMAKILGMFVPRGA